MGLRFSSVEAPFSVKDGFVMVSNAKAKAYGGELTAKGAKNLRSSNWGGLIELKSADLAPALRDAMPEMPGTIAGSFDLIIGMGGDTQKTDLQDGGGSLEIKNGSIKDFSWMSAMSKVIGDRPIRFDRFFAPFTLDGHNVYLLPGTRVSAPKGDAVFNYLMANGSFSLDRDVNLECMGNVNIRALNGFAGGLQGLASGMIDSGTSGLTMQNFLGGAITGLVKDEFRDVSLSIKGNSEDIGVQNISITQKTKIDFTPILNEDEKRREKEDDQIKINVEFSVGPGEAERGNGIGGQIGGQILERVLKGLVFPK
jgi:translocation and assembly module TamB